MDDLSRSCNPSTVDHAGRRKGRFISEIVASQADAGLAAQLSELSSEMTDEVPLR